MNFDEFYSKLALSVMVIMGKGLKQSEVDVMITKSSGDTLFCLMNGNDVIDYLRWNDG